MGWGELQRPGAGCSVEQSSAWGMRPPGSNQCLVPLTPMGWAQPREAVGKGTQGAGEGGSAAPEHSETSGTAQPKVISLTFLIEKKPHNLFFCLISVRELITLGRIGLFLLTWLVNEDSVT